MPKTYQPGPLIAPLSSSSVISSDHFGVNTLLSYSDLADPEDPLSQSLAEMGSGRLRYPGGAITEQYSDQIMDHVLYGTLDPSVWSGLDADPLYLDEVLSSAAETNAAISVVIPTVEAFEKSAQTALLDGSYGNRSLKSYDLSSEGNYVAQLSKFAEAVGTAKAEGQSLVVGPWEGDYLRETRQYVSKIMQLADAAGVRVSAFEIGNEYWGSGQMTAAEYGNLAASVANSLASDFQSSQFAGYQSTQAAPELLVQSLASVGTYSPNGARLIEIDGQSHWVPDQGSAKTQNKVIIQALNDAGAGDNIDGVINHYYFNKGLQAVDTNPFVFKQLERWSSDLARSSGLDELSYHITEWDVGLNDPDNGGLQQGQMLIEQFYEMIRFGVDGADIWPLHFYQVQGTSLTDDATQNLALGGETFRLMSESLTGLSPVLDWEVEGEIDIHGYSDAKRLVLFVSERSGQDQADVTLELSRLGVDSGSFQSAVILSNDLPDTVDPQSSQFANALPVLTTLRKANVFDLANENQLRVELEDWSILRLEFEFQGNAHEAVVKELRPESAEIFRQTVETSLINAFSQGLAEPDFVQSASGQLPQSQNFVALGPEFSTSQEQFEQAQLQAMLQSFLSEYLG